MRREINIIGKSSLIPSQIKKLRGQYEHQQYENHISLWKSNLEFSFKYLIK
jgi:hypothetical protein